MSVNLILAELLLGLELGIQELLNLLLSELLLGLELLLVLLGLELGILIQPLKLGCNGAIQLVNAELLFHQLRQIVNLRRLSANLLLAELLLGLELGIQELLNLLLSELLLGLELLLVLLGVLKLGCNGAIQLVNAELEARVHIIMIYFAIDFAVALINCLLLR